MVAVVVAAIVADAETGEAVEAVKTVNPTTTKVKIKLKPKLQPVLSRTNEVPSILTYLPVLGGPVLSTGRRVAKLLIVAIPLSASGSVKWSPELQLTPNLIIEKLASLVIKI